MLNLFILEDKNGNHHIVGASNIWNYVKENNYRVNFEYLINLIEKDNFPQKHMIKIKIHMLNYYSALINSYDNMIRGENENYKYAFYIYNSLKNNDNEINKCKNCFLYSFLSLIVDRSMVTIFHKGKKFKKACQDWKNIKYIEYFYSETIDFNELSNILSKDFHNYILELENNNEFQEEDEVEYIKLNKKLSNLK